MFLSVKQAELVVFLVRSLHSHVFMKIKFHVFSFDYNSCWEKLKSFLFSKSYLWALVPYLVFLRSFLTVSTRFPTWLLVRKTKQFWINILRPLKYYHFCSVCWTIVAECMKKLRSSFSHLKYLPPPLQMFEN